MNREKSLGTKAKHNVFLEGKWMDDGFANVLTSVIFMFSDKCHMNDFTPLILRWESQNEQIVRAATPLARHDVSNHYEARCSCLFLKTYLPARKFILAIV